jgi:hypothetical protein
MRVCVSKEGINRLKELKEEAEKNKKQRIKSSRKSYFGLGGNKLSIKQLNKDMKQFSSNELPQMDLESEEIEK